MLLLLLLLTLFAPKIASTALVRNYVAGKISQGLNGRVTIDDWSVSWSGGIDVRGVRVYDDHGQFVLGLAHAKTDLSLLDALRGRYDLGDCSVEEPDLVRLDLFPDGTNTYGRLVKASPSDSSAHSASSRPPEGSATKPLHLSGNFTVTRIHGTVTDLARRQVLHLDPASTVVVKIKSIDDPIDHAVKLSYRVNEGGTPSTVDLTGTATVGQGGQIRPDHIAVNDKLELADVDLGGLSPLLRLAGVKLDLGGTIRTDGPPLAIQFRAPADFTADGIIGGTRITAGGEALGGDQYRTATLAMPIHIARVEGAAPNAATIKGGVDLVTDQGKITFTVDAPESALANLAAGRAPGSAGKVSLTANVAKLSDLARQLRHALNLQQGVDVTGGSLDAEATLALSPAAAAATVRTRLDGLTGTRAGHAISLQPVQEKLKFVVKPTAATGTAVAAASTALPNVEQIQLGLDSGFASLHGGGQTLAGLKITGTCDLTELQKQLGDFFDFGTLKMAGTGEVTLATTGDWSKPADPIHANLSLTGKSLLLHGVAGLSDLNEPLVTFAAEGEVRRLSAVAVISEAKLTSGLANATLSGEAALNAPGLLEMLRKLDVRVEVPDVGRLAALNAPPALLARAEPKESPAPRLPLMMPLMMPRPMRAMTVADATPAPDAPTPPPTTGRPKRSQHQRDLDAAAQAATQPTQPATSAPAQAAPAATQPSAPAVAAEPTTQPIQWRKGSATLALSVERDDSAGLTRVKDAELTLNGLAFDRGPAHYVSTAHGGANSFHFAAEIVGADDPQHPDRPLLEVIRTLRVTALAGQTDVGDLTMSQPITLSDLSATPKAAGAVQLAGKVHDVMEFVNALQGKRPEESPRASGDYTLTQSAQTDGTAITLGTVGKFTGIRIAPPTAPATPPAGQPTPAAAAPTTAPAGEFAEDLIELNSDLRIDTPTAGTHDAALRTLSLATKTSGALKLSASGTVRDFTRACKFDGVTFKIDPDLAKLWDLLGPMLPADTRESLKGMKIAGKGERTFTIAGSFPQDKPAAQAFASLSVDGSLAIESLDIPSNGLSVKNADLPLKIHEGKITAETPKQPAVCNGGKLYTHGTFDLADPSDPHPRLSLPAGKLIDAISINPAFSQTFLGKFVNPSFVDPKEAKGQLDVTVVRCDRVPLDELVESTAAQNDGRAEITFSLTGVRIASPGLGALMNAAKLGDALGAAGAAGDTIEGSIRDGRIVVERGHVKHQMTLQLDKYAIKFDGDLDLANRSFVYLNMTVPQEALARIKILKQVAKALPDGWTFRFHGPAASLKLDAKSSTDAILKEVMNKAGKNPAGLLDGINGLRGGKDK